MKKLILVLVLMLITINLFANGGVILKTTDGSFVHIDNITKTLSTVSLEHCAIHAGMHFTTQDYDNDVDIASPKYWIISTTQTAKESHLVVRMSATMNGTFEVFVSSYYNTPGTLLNTFCNKYLLKGLNGLKIFSDGNGFSESDSNRVLANVIGTDGTNPLGAAGGIAERDNEFIVEYSKSSNYLVLKYTALTNNNRVSCCVEHYEVE